MMEVRETGKNRKKRWIIAGTLCLFLVLLFFWQPSGKESLAAWVEESVDGSSIYSQYPVDAYSLDFWCEDEGFLGISGAGYGILNLLANAVFGISNLFSYFVGWLLEEAYTVDFLSSAITTLSTNIQTIAGVNQAGLMSHGLIPSFAPILILLAGAYFAWTGIVKRQVSRAFANLAAFTAVFVLGMGVIAYSGSYLNLFNNFQKELNAEVMDISSRITTGEDGDGAVSQMRDNLFVIMVRTPYLMFQYGTSDLSAIGEDRVSEMLSASSEERQDLAQEEVEDMGNEYMGTGHLAERLGMSLVVLLINLVVGVCVLILAGMMIMAQVLFVVYVSFFPVALAFSLFPNSGGRLSRILDKCLETVLMRPAITLILAVVFSLSMLCYNLSGSGNFLWMMFLQGLVFIVAVVKSGELLGFMKIGKEGGGERSFMKTIVAGLGARAALRGAKGAVRIAGKGLGAAAGAVRDRAVRPGMHAAQNRLAETGLGKPRDWKTDTPGGTGYGSEQAGAAGYSQAAAGTAGRTAGKAGSTNRTADGMDVRSSVYGSRSAQYQTDGRTEYSQNMENRSGSVSQRTDQTSGMDIRNVSRAEQGDIQQYGTSDGRSYYQDGNSREDPDNRQNVDVRDEMRSGDVSETYRDSMETDSSQSVDVRDQMNFGSTSENYRDASETDARQSMAEESRIRTGDIREEVRSDSSVDVRNQTYSGDVTQEVHNAQQIHPGAGEKADREGIQSTARGRTEIQSRGGASPNTVQPGERPGSSRQGSAAADSRRRPGVPGKEHSIYREDGRQRMGQDPRNRKDQPSENHAGKARAFRNVESRPYNYDELERQLLNGHAGQESVSVQRQDYRKPSQDGTKDVREAVRSMEERVPSRVQVGSTSSQSSRPVKETYQETVRPEKETYRESRLEKENHQEHISRMEHTETVSRDLSDHRELRRETGKAEHTAERKNGKDREVKENENGRR